MNRKFKGNQKRKCFQDQDKGKTELQLHSGERPDEPGGPAAGTDQGTRSSTMSTAAVEQGGCSSAKKIRLSVSTDPENIMNKASVIEKSQVDGSFIIIKTSILQNIIMSNGVYPECKDSNILMKRRDIATFGDCIVEVLCGKNIIFLSTYSYLQV